MKARSGWLLLVLGLLFLVLTRAISEVSFALARPVYASLRAMDPDGSYLLISVHHVLQGIFALLAILSLSRILHMPLREFGFNFDEWRYAVRLVLCASCCWFLVQGLAGAWMVSRGYASAAFSFPLTSGNVLSYFAFQILLSGTSEEILFRAMVMTPLLWYGQRAGLSKKAGAWLAWGVATLIFMAAHINIALHPLRITHFNILQQLTVFIFGSFYAFLFVKTRSLAGPMLAHNVLNGVIVVVGLVLFRIFGR